jgi:hypothetical protein
LGIREGFRGWLLAGPIFLGAGLVVNARGRIEPYHGAAIEFVFRLDDRKFARSTAARRISLLARTSSALR